MNNSATDISSFFSLINSVPLKQFNKQILILLYIENKDINEIGDMLGCSYKDVKKANDESLAMLCRLF